MTLIARTLVVSVVLAGLARTSEAQPIVIDVILAGRSAKASSSAELAAASFDVRGYLDELGAPVP